MKLMLRIALYEASLSASRFFSRIANLVPEYDDNDEPARTYWLYRTLELPALPFQWLYQRIDNREYETLQKSRSEEQRGGMRYVYSSETVMKETWAAAAKRISASKLKP
jgi:hypothetical protein